MNVSPYLDGSILPTIAAANCFHTAYIPSSITTTITTTSPNRQHCHSTAHTHPKHPNTHQISNRTQPSKQTTAQGVDGSAELKDRDLWPVRLASHPRYVTPTPTPLPSMCASSKRRPQGLALSLWSCFGPKIWRGGGGEGGEYFGGNRCALYHEDWLTQV